jgi:hypothetical protein
MAKEKTLSSFKKTSSSAIKTSPAPKSVEPPKNEYKEALMAIVEASDKLEADSLNRNNRIALKNEIAKAKAIL